MYVVSSFVICASCQVIKWSRIIDGQGNYCNEVRVMGRIVDGWMDGKIQGRADMLFVVCVIDTHI